MAYRNCATQDEADAAAAAGDMIMWRAGNLVLRGSSSASLYNYSGATLYDSSYATLYDNSHADLFGSSRANLYDNSSAALHDRSIVVLHGNSSATDGITGAPLRRDRPRIVLGPLGSRADMLGVSLPSDGTEPIVYAGCWYGRLSAFAARVDAVYPASRYGDEYRAAIAMIRAVATMSPQGAT